MLERILGRVNSAHLVALLALFVALGGTAYALSNNSVKSKHIKDGTIKSADLKDDNVKSADLKNDNVKSADLKDGDVSSADLKDGDVSSADLKDGDVGSSDLGTNSVTTSKIEDDAVTAAKIAPGVIPDPEDPCGPGRPKAIFMIRGSTLTTSFEAIDGYHCSGGSIEARSPSTGNYEFDIDGLAFDTTTRGMVVQLTAQGGSGGTIIGYGAGGSSDRLSVFTYNNAGTEADKLFSVTIWEDSPPAP